MIFSFKIFIPLFYHRINVLISFFSDNTFLDPKNLTDLDIFDFEINEIENNFKVTLFLINAKFKRLFKTKMANLIRINSLKFD